MFLCKYLCFRFLSYCVIMHEHLWERMRYVVVKSAITKKWLAYDLYANHFLKITN